MTHGQLNCDVIMLCKNAFLAIIQSHNSETDIGNIFYILSYLFGETKVWLSTL